MYECFTPDQKIANDTDAFIAAIKAKDFGNIKSIIMGDEPLAIKDTEACMTDPKYAQIRKAEEFQQALVEKAMADPDWQLHALKGVKGHLDEIKQSAQDAIAAWDAGNYYGAGQKIGSIDKLVFTFWETNSAFLQ